MEDVGPSVEIGGARLWKVLFIVLLTWSSFLKLRGATETGTRQDDFVVQRNFSGSDGQVRGNGDETRELGF